MTVVTVSNPVYGDSFGICHVVKAESALVAMQFTPPIGTQMEITFTQPESIASGYANPYIMPVRMVARAEARLHVHAAQVRGRTLGPCVDFAIIGWL